MAQAKGYIEKCQLLHCPIFPMDQQWGQVDQPSCGELSHCEHSLKQKALEVLWMGAWVGAEQDGKGRAGNRKVLSVVSE